MIRAWTNETIGSLTNLRDLSLVATSVTDASLEQLNVLAGLKELKLTSTKVTAAGVADLQKALPECKITWDGGHSESGKK